MLVRLRVFLSRLSGWCARRQDEGDFGREIETHLALLTERFMRQGMTAAEAAFAAQREFGGIARVQQERREARGFFRLDLLLQDLRYAVRTLAKTPAFTATAVAVLALGIGANTAIFSVVNAVLLKPLKAPGADRIVRFLVTGQGPASPTASLPQFNMWRGQTAAFEDVSAHRQELADLTGVADPEQIPIARVSSDFFRLFGGPVLRGRTLTPDEDRPNGGHAAVLSHAFWVRRYAGNPQILGQTIMLGSAPYVVVGILGPGFDSEQFDPLPDVWVPFQIDPDTTDRSSYCTVTGRLKSGTTLAAARERLKPAAEEYRRMLPTIGSTAGFTVQTLRDATAGDVRPSLLLLLGAVSFVLLIACANVANLSLVRAAGRRRELAIRAAVGASRGRIVRQLLTESLMLALSGGVLGLLLGNAGIRTLLTDGPSYIPRIGAPGAVAMDWRVLLFTVLVSLTTGILFGIVPAWQSSRADLKGADVGAGFRIGRARSLFVIGEMALTLILLVAAALLIRTYLALHSVDPGFDTHNVLTAQMSLTGTGFEETGALDSLVRSGVRRIRALPGVTAASAACCIPLETVWQLPFIVQGRPLNGPYHAFAGWTFVSPEYFSTFHIPIQRGRAFTEHDDAAAPGVVIVNQAMARQFWPNSEPLDDSLIIGRGMRPEYAEEPTRRIVGIAGDIRDRGLHRDPRPAMYVPIAQLPDAVNVINLRLLPIAWFVRIQAQGFSGKYALASAIQNELQRASGGLPAAHVRSMDQVAAQSTSRTQFQMLLMTIFGAAALLLASIGIYGLMAYSVQQRTHEIGIRMALGAGPGDLRNMVVRQGLRVAMIGVFIGIGAGFGLAHFIAGFLFGVKAWDPAVFIGVPVLLCAVVLAAIWLPAGRATRVDPAIALRHE